MRILILANKDFGLYKFRKELIKKLVDEEYDVYISCPAGDKIDYFKSLGCKIVETNLDRRGTSISNDFKLVAFYFKILKNLKPDVVLTYTTKCSIYGGFACKIKKVPYIVNNCGLLTLSEENKKLQGFIDFLYKISVNKTECMMYQNTLEMENLNKLLNNKVKYRLIPGSGVNTGEYYYSEYPSEKEDITFNFVGRILKEKGIEEFLIVAKKIKEKYPKVKFNLFGSFEENKYKDMLNEYNDLGIVNYMGTKSELRPYIEKSFAIIHPSYSEGMTNVCLEHASMGRVCLASNINGCKEIIKDNLNGYLFKSKNTESLYNAIEKFINLPYEQKKAMGIAGRKKMEAEFDRNIVIDAYMKEIENILK